jgi:hypothetical protein
MHRIQDTLSEEISSVHDIMELLCFARTLAVRPFQVSISDVEIFCIHPLTNQGAIDEDYLVIHATGFEQCEVWFYKGEFDLPSTHERFRMFGVKNVDIKELRKIYQRAIVRLSVG